MVGPYQYHGWIDNANSNSDYYRQSHDTKQHVTNLLVYNLSKWFTKSLLAFATISIIDRKYNENSRIREKMHFENFHVKLMFSSSLLLHGEVLYKCNNAIKRVNARFEFQFGHSNKSILYLASEWLYLDTQFFCILCTDFALSLQKLGTFYF